ncbi:uncharacterized protein TNCV_3539041 [Trichonephila clavipes]|nr:uncharacterized protein TNCV_3539041 [Trichonephila clavipes]
MEIKLPSSGLLLIVLSLWRLIQLSTVKFAYSAFNTLAKIFAENPARFIHCHDTCNSWATYQAFDDDEEPIGISQLPAEESGCLTGEGGNDEDTFHSVLPADVCGKIEISTNIVNDEISHEDMFDPEEFSTTKGMSNLKRKLKPNETNV